MSERFDDVFGRLLIDARARAHFLRDPAIFARSLDGEAAEWVRQLDPVRLQVAAAGLLTKRARHAAELLPSLCAALGASFERCFVERAQAWLIEGYAQHRADAWAFAHELSRSHDDDGVRQVAREETQRLARGFRLRRRQASREALPTYSSTPARRPWPWPWTRRPWTRRPWTRRRPG